jgi:hypothetical protein
VLTSEVFGVTATALAAPFIIAPVGVLTGEVLGLTVTVLVPPQPVTAQGIATGEASGYLIVAPVAALSVNPVGVSSGEVFGLTVSNLVPPQPITPLGVVSGELVSQMTTSLVPPQPIAAWGIASGEAFGPVVGIDFIANLVSLDSAEMFGVVIMVPGPVGVAFSGIASAEAVGYLRMLPDQPIRLASVPDTSVMGLTQTAPGTVTLTQAGVASAEAMGAILSMLYLIEAGIASEEKLGPTVVLSINLMTFSGVLSAEAFGTFTYSTIAFIDPASMPSLETFGIQEINLATRPAAIRSGETFGRPVTAGGPVFTYPVAIATTEHFGYGPVTAFVTKGADDLFGSVFYTAVWE